MSKTDGLQSREQLSLVSEDSFGETWLINSFGYRGATDLKVTVMRKFQPLRWGFVLRWCLIFVRTHGVELGEEGQRPPGFFSDWTAEVKNYSLEAGEALYVFNLDLLIGIKEGTVSIEIEELRGVLSNFPPIE